MLYKRCVYLRITCDLPFTCVQQRDEVALVKALLDRLAQLTQIIEDATTAMFSYPDDLTVDKTRISSVYLYYQFLELQIARWDLRKIVYTTGKLWPSLLWEKQLSWHACWTGDDAAVDGILDLMSVMLEAYESSESSSDNPDHNESDF